MNILRLSSVGVLSALSVSILCARQDAGAPAPGPAPAAAAAPAASPPPAELPAPGFTDTQLVEEFGWFVGKRMGLGDLHFTPAEVDALTRGVASASAGKDSPYDLQKIGPAMDEFVQKKQSVYVGEMKAKSKDEAAAFFAKLSENKNIVTLPDGLRYEIIKPGEGDYPTAKDGVKVNYTGTLVNGTVFDSSVQRGQPAEFQLDQVIPGWTEGLQKINRGGKIKLYVPAHLAYGDQGQGGIPPGATLIFDIDLLDIKPAAGGAASEAPGTPPSPPAEK